MMVMGFCWLVDNNETYWNFLYSRKLQIESFQPWNLGIYQLPQLIQPVQARQWPSCCFHEVSSLGATRSYLLWLPWLWDHTELPSFSLIQLQPSTVMPSDIERIILYLPCKGIDGLIKGCKWMCFRESLRRKDQAQHSCVAWFHWKQALPCGRLASSLHLSW